MNELLFLGKTICHNIIQFHVLTGCDSTSYFYGVGKIKLFQKIMKNTNILQLISNLGHKVSADDNAIKNCAIFIQTVLYNGISKETYMKAKIQLYNNQKTKNSVSLTEGSLSCKPAIRRANYQSCYWLHCIDKVFSQLSLMSNG